MGMFSPLLTASNKNVLAQLMLYWIFYACVKGPNETCEGPTNKHLCMAFITEQGNRSL